MYTSAPMSLEMQARSDRFKTALWGGVPLNSYEEGARPVQAALTGVVQRAIELLELPSKPLVLEVGAGTGFLKDCLPEEIKDRYVSLEFHSRYLAEGRKRRELTAVSGDLHQLPFRDSTFDLVIAKDAINVVGSLSLATCEIARVLKRGGWLAEIDLRNPMPAFLEDEYPDLTFIPGMHEHQAYGLTNDQLKRLKGLIVDPEQSEFVNLFLNGPWFPVFLHYHNGSRDNPVIRGLLEKMIEIGMQVATIQDVFGAQRQLLGKHATSAGLRVGFSEFVTHEGHVIFDPTRHDSAENVFRVGVRGGENKYDQEFATSHPGKVSEIVEAFLFLAQKL